MRSFHRGGLLCWGLLFLLLALPLASAHAGGGGGVETRIRMPAWVTWVTGASVVAVSFAVVGAFLTKPATGGRALAAGTEGAVLLSRPGLHRAGRALGLVTLALVIANGFLPGGGGALPQAVVWLGLWSLLPLLAYTVGNVWALVSPFRALAPLADRLRGERAPLAYPRGLAAWPAVALFVALVGLEVTAGDASAARVAHAALAYTLLTFAGMALFGSAAWLANAEVFDRAFRWWSAFSFVRWTREGPRLCAPGAGLHGRVAADASDVAFVVALLYGVNFDGFLATGPGLRTLEGLEALLGPALAHGALLVAGYLVFLGAFWACVHGLRAFSESLDPPTRLATRLVASLLPIAVAYHLAHNLFYAAEALPLAWSALRDPLGLAGAPVEAVSALALPEGLALAAGGVQMLLIVLGHVSAVVVAHALAFASFPSRVQAIRSELPLTVAMVFYTLVGLWIVGQGAAPLSGVGA